MKAPFDRFPYLVLKAADVTSCWPSVASDIPDRYRLTQVSRLAVVGSFWRAAL